MVPRYQSRVYCQENAGPVPVGTFGKLAGNKGQGLLLTLVRFEKPVAIDYKLRLKLMGAGAWFSTADWPLFKGGDRHQLHTGVRKKTLFSLIQSVDSEVTFLDWEPRFPRQCQHDVTGNAIEDAAI